MLRIGDTFNGYEDAVTALKHHEKCTHEMFVNGHGHTKLSKTHPHASDFVYSSMKFVCKHHGRWRSHRKNYSAHERPHQTTIKTGCAAFVKFKVIGNTVTVVALPELSSHNHPVTDLLSQFYPENRQMQKSEAAELQDLLDCGVQRAAICSKINKQRDQLGVPGRLITKDVHNSAAKLKKESKAGKTEGQILEDYLQNLVEADPESDIRCVTSPNDCGEDVLSILYIQTPDMRNNLMRHGQAMFMDSTYRLNCEHFCLYSIVVEDENGFGQPVVLAFLRDEKKATLEKLFEIFKSANADCLRNNQSIFVDKDFTQMSVLQKMFPSSKVLLCAFHTMKTWKTKLASQRLGRSEKEDILGQFKRVLHAASPLVFDVEETKLKVMLPEKLRAYYFKNWGSNKEMWSFAFQRQLLTFRNRTTNRIERWFLMIKTAFRNSGRSIWTRYHLKECVEIVLKVVSQKLHIARYEDFVNKGKSLVLHQFPFPDCAQIVGQSLTKVAALIVQNQLTWFSKQEYEVSRADSSEWTVVNISSTLQSAYEVLNGQAGFACNCYTNCTFGLPCRHIFHIRKTLNLPLFSITDVISKWHRGSDTAFIDYLSKESVDAAITGEADEESESTTKRRVTDSNTIGRRFTTTKKLCTRIASAASHFGGTQFHSVLETLNYIEESLLNGVIPIVQRASPGATLGANRSSLVLRSTTLRKPKGRPNEGTRFKRFNNARLSVNQVNTMDEN